MIRSAARLALAGFVLALVLWLAQNRVAELFSGWPSLRDEAALATLAAIGVLVYGGVTLALFGRDWLAWLRGRRASPQP